MVKLEMFIFNFVISTITNIINNNQIIQRNREEETIIPCPKNKLVMYF